MVVTGLRVSVVVMTFNRPRSLRSCLMSLAAQSLPREAFEVVVVDVSDTPATEMLAEFVALMQVVHAIGPNRGVAANRNTGVSRARAPVVAFLDDDCVADAGWLEAMTTSVEANPGCLVGGAVELARVANLYARTGQVITDAVHSFFNPLGHKPRFLPGLNFALMRMKYLEIGGCDERFGTLAAEDRDLNDRWRLTGGGLLCCPTASVRHEHRGTLLGFGRQYFNYGRGAWRYHRLRRQRVSGRMTDAVRLHLHLLRHLGQSLRSLPPGKRVPVVCLLAVWQLTNAAGFAWQGIRETTFEQKELG